MMTDHERDEEVERRELLVRDEPRAVPEDKSHDEEDHCLRQCPKQIAPHRSPLRVLERLVEAASVDVAAVIFSSERGNCPDSTCGLASELRRVLVCFLVLLVLEDNYTLMVDDVNGMLAGERRSTYQANVSTGHNQRRARDTDETQLPGESQTNGKTANQSSNALNNTERRTSVIVSKRKCSNTYAPSVTPARPSIFSGLSLSPEVREPVCKIKLAHLSSRQITDVRYARPHRSIRLWPYRVSDL